MLDNSVPELRGLIVNLRDVLYYRRTCVVDLCTGCENSRMKRIVITKYLRHSTARYYGVVDESSVGSINIQLFGKDGQQNKNMSQGSAYNVPPYWVGVIFIPTVICF